MRNSSKHLEKIKDSIFYSIGIDESTVRKTGQLVIVVSYFDQDIGLISTIFYKTLKMFWKDTKSTVDEIVSCLHAYEIEYTNNLIHIGTDSCATMRGRHSGVIKRFQEINDNIHDLGGCPNHHVCNLLKYGMIAMDPLLKILFVDVYQWLEKETTHKTAY